MLSTVAITAALAVAPAVDARFSFADLKKKYSGPRTPAPENGGFKKGGYKNKSSAKCVAVSGVSITTAAKDAHASAIKYAWRYACSEDPSLPDFYWQLIKNVVDKEKKSGFAFAKAIAAAETECNASGNAYGCAAAWAHAHAWEEATIDAQAVAWAEAVNTCECNDKDQIAAAGADALAWEHETLSARVEAAAEAHTCVDGSGYEAPKYGKDWGAQTCIESIYATAIAKAVAIAAIDGQCVKKHKKHTDTEYGDFIAIAKAEAEASIEVDYLYGCVGYVETYIPDFVKKAY